MCKSGDKCDTDVSVTSRLAVTAIRSDVYYNNFRTCGLWRLWSKWISGKEAYTFIIRLYWVSCNQRESPCDIAERVSEEVSDVGSKCESLSTTKTQLFMYVNGAICIRSVEGYAFVNIMRSGGKTLISIISKYFLHERHRNSFPY